MKNNLLIAAISSTLLLTACGGASSSSSVDDSAVEVPDVPHVPVEPETDGEQGGDQGGDQTNNTPPVISDQNILNTSIASSSDGRILKGSKLKATYSYSDADGDKEGLTKFQWYRGAVAISGANSQTYQTTNLDASAQIHVKITPYAESGTQQGIAKETLAVNVFDVVVRPVKSVDALDAPFKLGILSGSRSESILGHKLEVLEVEGLKEPHPLYPVGTKYVFWGDSEEFGTEPWVTDGTAEGTFMLKDTVSGADGGHKSVEEIKNSPDLYSIDQTSILHLGGDKVVFVSDGLPWVTDGTVEGTFELERLAGYEGDPNAGKFKEFKIFNSYVNSSNSGGLIFFSSKEEITINSESIESTAIWFTDGTLEGTKKIILMAQGTQNFYPIYAERGTFKGESYLQLVGSDKKKVMFAKFDDETGVATPVKTFNSRYSDTSNLDIFAAAQVMLKNFKSGGTMCIEKEFLEDFIHIGAVIPTGNTSYTCTNTNLDGFTETTLVPDSVNVRILGPDKINGRFMVSAHKGFGLEGTYTVEGGGTYSDVKYYGGSNYLGSVDMTERHDLFYKEDAGYGIAAVMFNSDFYSDNNSIINGRYYINIMTNLLAPNVTGDLWETKGTAATTMKLVEDNTEVMAINFKPALVGGNVLSARSLGPDFDKYTDDGGYQDGAVLESKVGMFFYDPNSNSISVKQLPNSSIGTFEFFEFAGKHYFANNGEGVAGEDVMKMNMNYLIGKIYVTDGTAQGTVPFISNNQEYILW